MTNPTAETNRCFYLFELLGQRANELMKILKRVEARLRDFQFLYETEELKKYSEFTDLSFPS